MRLLHINQIVASVFIFIVVFSCSDEAIETPVNDEQIATSDDTTQLILDWNALWLQVDRQAFGMRPTSTSRSLAYIHLAAYETAVSTMNNFTSNSPRFENFYIDDNQRPEEIQLDIALNTCYALVMSHFMHNVAGDMYSEIAQFKDEKELALSQGISTTVSTDSRQWGAYIAQQVIAFSQTDVEAEQQLQVPQPLEYEPAIGDGYWTYSANEERAWFPYWESVRTFVISLSETSTVPPSAIYSDIENSDYYNQMYEVYTLNNTAKEENNDDLWIAEFWSDDVEGLMLSPPGRQFSIAGQLVNQFDLEYDATLALFLKLGFSLNDASVSCWADKYAYMAMRPNVYINEFIDPDFQTNLYRFIFWPNPSFPSYPSGHSTFASAAAGLFIETFGNNVNFTDFTHQDQTEFRGAPREFNTLSEMAEENAFSRIPLGVHVRMDCTEGYRLGYEIADAVNAFDLTSN
ncbi:MAG: vanadium-dependent haloperoxidase [Psychroserpens sp.]|uniref:vanadium-dependent haloperoxidase n=1 Tax=Psychroserpens sp. TaxID=2020870 RepID=UPI003CA4B98D